ncbi:MAG: holo-ACP synthase [Acidaminococcaceae bacterium]|nr:holo-ACP synthase [Acidaminococcaceae bacterium]
MIGGIGCDLCAIERMEKAVAKKGFLERVFTVQEQEYCEKRLAHKYASLAGRFAAKEAVLKAFGTGLRGGKLQEIEVVTDKFGKPSIRLFGYFQKLAEQLGVVNWHLSLTHEQGYAAAFVVMEVEK